MGVQKSMVFSKKIFSAFLCMILNPHILLAERLDNLCSADEYHFDSFF